MKIEPIKFEFNIPNSFLQNDGLFEAQVSMAWRRATMTTCTASPRCRLDAPGVYDTARQAIRYHTIHYGWTSPSARGCAGRWALSLALIHNRLWSTCQTPFSIPTRLATSCIVTATVQGEKWASKSLTLGVTLSFSLQVFPQNNVFNQVRVFGCPAAVCAHWLEYYWWSRV